MVYYYFVINIISFGMFGIDKIKSIHALYRIPEKMLLGVSFLGGGIGSFCGMNIFHHKIKKMKFILFVPFSIVIHIFFIYILYKKLFLV